MAFGLRLRERSRIAVLSPHLDDGILSLGASIAEAAREGHDVAVVTVFAGDPDSTNAPGRWDRRAGFATAGEAARTRREEDARACRLVHARPVWLAFADADYDEPRDPDEISGAIDAAVGAAEAVLVPGRPLLHADHAWLAHVVLARRENRSIGAYAELPYDVWQDVERCQPLPVLAEANWTAPRLSLPARIAKWKAVQAYESQLPWLERGLRYRRALLRARVGHERIAWL